MYQINYDEPQAKLFFGAMDWFNENEGKEHQVTEVLKDIVQTPLGKRIEDRKIIRKGSVDAFVKNAVDLQGVLESYAILVWFKSVTLSREQLLNVIKFCDVIRDLMKERGK